MVLVAFGLGAVAAGSALVFDVIKFVGAAYLVYLGVQTIRHRGDLTAVLGASPGPADRRLYWQGFVIGFTNPKVLVFFAAVLPQFVDAGAGSATTQMLFALIASVLDSAWGLATRTWFVSWPARLRRVGGLAGAMMIVMGAGPALTGRRD